MYTQEMCVLSHLTLTTSVKLKSIIITSFAEEETEAQSLRNLKEVV